MANQFTSWVRPGVREVFANPFTPTRALITEDLPTLDLPANAISGTVGAGNPVDAAADVTKTAFLAFIAGASAVSTASKDPEEPVVGPMCGRNYTKLKFPHRSTNHEARAVATRMDSA